VHFIAEFKRLDEYMMNNGTSIDVFEQLDNYEYGDLCIHDIMLYFKVCNFFFFLASFIYFILNLKFHFFIYISICLEGSSFFVLQNLEILESMLNVAKSRDTEMGSPLGLTNGCMGSTDGGSSLGGGVAVVASSNSITLPCSVSLDFSPFNQEGLLFLPC
jgi:hypothetical protein